MQQINVVQKIKALNKSVFDEGSAPPNSLDPKYAQKTFTSNNYTKTTYSVSMMEQSKNGIPLTQSCIFHFLCFHAL